MDENENGSGTTGAKPRVVVLGAGVVGVASSYFLARAGCDVTVVTEQWYAVCVKQQRLVSPKGFRIGADTPPGPQRKRPGAGDAADGPWRRAQRPPALLLVLRRQPSTPVVVVVAVIAQPPGASFSGGVLLGWPSITANNWLWLKDPL